VCTPVMQVCQCLPRVVRIIQRNSVMCIASCWCVVENVTSNFELIALYCALTDRGISCISSTKRERIVYAVMSKTYSTIKLTCRITSQVRHHSATSICQIIRPHHTAVSTSSAVFLSVNSRLIFQLHCTLLLE